MTIKEELKPEPQNIWRGVYRDIQYKVAHHGKGLDYTPGRDGIWNYYVYLHEDRVNDFARIWLNDEIRKYKPDVKGYVSHDYYGCRAFDDIHFHGGITYYAKHGHTEGFRCVEIGCDYNHLWYQERGYGYDLETILFDVKETIDSAYEIGLIIPDETKMV